MTPAIGSAPAASAKYSTAKDATPSSTGALDPPELFRRDAKCSDAGLIRALADDVEVGELRMKPLGDLDDLLVHGSKEQFVSCSPSGPLRIFFHALPFPLDTGQRRPGKHLWKRVALSRFQPSSHPAPPLRASA